MSNFSLLTFPRDLFASWDREKEKWRKCTVEEAKDELKHQDSFVELGGMKGYMDRAHVSLLLTNIKAPKSNKPWKWNFKDFVPMEEHNDQTALRRMGDITTTKYGQSIVANEQIIKVKQILGKNLTAWYSKKESFPVIFVNNNLEGMVVAPTVPV